MLGQFCRIGAGQ